MKPVLEPPRVRPETMSIVAFERWEAAFPWNWHFHPEMELTLIREGSGTRLVGDSSQEYAPGDLVLLGSNLPHTWISHANSRRRRCHRAIVVQFHPAMLPPPLLGLPEFTTIGRLFDASSCGQIFPEADRESVESAMEGLLNSHGLSRWLKLAEILESLSHCSPRTLASARYHHHRSYRLSSRLDRVISHIEKHFHEELSIRDVSRVAGLTPGAFSRFFHKFMHRTFVDYRNSRRIREACRLLEETDLSVTEIAHQCGFNNLANFNRRFLQEKGTPPRQYRNRYEPQRRVL